MAGQLPSSQQASAPRRGETARELALLAIRRITSAPRLSAVLLIGALLAVGLASSAPIFIEAVRDLGLRQTLADADPAALDLRVVRSNISANPESVDSVETVIRAEADAAVGEFSVGRMVAIRTGGYILRSDDQPFNSPDTLHATFLAQNDINEAAWLLAGRLPTIAEGAIEVVVESQQAARFGLDVDDERLAQPFWLGSQHETRVRVVGLVEPSADERRWSTLDPLYLPVAARDSELRFWTTRESILGILADQSPTLRLTLLQRYRTNLSGVSAAEASAAADALEQMTRRIAQAIDGVQQETELVDTLVGFRERFRFAQSTLLMIVLQLVGAVLVYAVVASAMLAEQRTEDTAWLRSRGARQRDVAMLHVVEAAILTAPAIVLGPLIGVGLISLLGFVPPYDQALADIGLGPFLPAPLPAESWYLALGAGALALIAQAVPTYRATRQTMVTTRRERGRPPASWTQRALIDAAVAALGALLIFELQWAGDPIDSPLVGETRLDWLAVATPTVLLFVVGLIVLRLFPPAMRALARAASPLRWLTLLLGAWYLGRTPTHYARTVLLLTIAGALAVFAASFRTTLDASYDDRALHAVGAAVRVQEPLSQSLPYAEIAELTGQPVAQIQRVTGTFDGDEDSGKLQVVALDSVTVAAQLRDEQVEWSTLPEELAALSQPDDGAERPVLQSGGRMSLHLTPVRVVQNVSVGIKVEDAIGRYWWYQLGELEALRKEPIELAATIGDQPTLYIPLEGARLVERRSAWRPGVEERPAWPLRLVSVDIALARAPGEVLLDRLEYRYGGDTRNLADFDPDIWQAMPLSAGEEPVDSLQPTEDGMSFRWDGTPTSLRGIHYRSDTSPLPVLLSAAAMEQGRLQIGEEVRLRIGPTPMKFRVVGQFETFPTYDAQRDDPIVIVDRAALVERIYGSASAGVSLAVDDELWVSAPFEQWRSLVNPGFSEASGDGSFEEPGDSQRVSNVGGIAVSSRRIVQDPNAETDESIDTLATDGAGAEGTQRVGVASIEDILTLDQARGDLAADPLIVASWNGVFIGALAAVAIASAFGLVVLTAVTAQARRVEFAVCQSVGMSMRQILAMIALEQLIVIAIGLGAGLVVGTQAGAILLDFFALTPDGRDVVPPLQFIVDWPGVAVLFGVLAGLFALNLGAFLWFLRRIELHGALRLAA
ncbi:MAG: FtsX-like permease family protein [Chloroflexi bacterium]|nr:FtsX-like permease family protein [Chloroflexota bacterium]MCY3697370.1 FtsX-like permease family protein [Chloroflexota bacterium]